MDFHPSGAGAITREMLAAVRQAERQRIAELLLVAIIRLEATSIEGVDPARAARLAVMATDALLARLRETQPK